jgi:hypothetical protein
MLSNKARNKHRLNKVEPPFNVPQLSCSFTYIKQQWSKSHCRVKYTPLQNFLSSIPKFNVIKRNLKWIFHHIYHNSETFKWSDNKVRELITVKVLHTSLLKTTMVTFKVLPLGSYTPMPVPSPPFKTTLELVLWHGLQSCHCITPHVINECLTSPISTLLCHMVYSGATPITVSIFLKSKKG